ncbi:MAG: hypothetical protein ACR2HV_02620 [Acidimicrobiales bacterium]
MAVVALGLGLGLGGISLYRSQTSDDRPSSTPTAKEFPFATPAVLPDVAPPADAAAAGPETEPVDAAAALTAFFQAEASGQTDVAWALLDSAGHQRWPTALTWSATRSERAPPVAFDLKAPTRSDATGDVDLGVDVTRTPSLDPFRGLVAARSSEVWRVRNTDGRWRVVAQPVESRPVLPADTTAPDTVRSWVDATVACDQPAAARLQVDANLLGPADVAASPCLQKGTWTVGSPVTVDRGGDVQPLLAAYGQGVTAWARLVPVEGPGRRFWAQVAPVGDTWMVVGVAAG